MKTKIKLLLLRWLFPDGMVVSEFSQPITKNSMINLELNIRINPKRNIKWIEKLARKKGWEYNKMD